MTIMSKSKITTFFSSIYTLIGFIAILLAPSGCSTDGTPPIHHTFIEDRRQQEAPLYSRNNYINTALYLKEPAFCQYPWVFQSSKAQFEVDSTLDATAELATSGSLKGNPTGDVALTLNAPLQSSPQGQSSASAIGQLTGNVDAPLSGTVKSTGKVRLTGTMNLTSSIGQRGDRALAHSDDTSSGTLGEYYIGIRAVFIPPTPETAKSYSSRISHLTTLFRDNEC